MEASIWLLAESRCPLYDRRTDAKLDLESLFFLFIFGASSKYVEIGPREVPAGFSVEPQGSPGPGKVAKWLGPYQLARSNVQMVTISQRLREPRDHLTTLDGVGSILEYPEAFESTK